MKYLILAVAIAFLGACSSDCTCTFGGKKYLIKQNAKGAIYGVPTQ